MAARTDIFTGFAGASAGGGRSERACRGRAFCGERIIRDQGEAAAVSCGRGDTTAAEAACGAQTGAFA